LEDDNSEQGPLDILERMLSAHNSGRSLATSG
jgi:hypothetical protein